VSGSFLEALRDRARAHPRRLAFPEGTEPRVQHALAQAIPTDLFQAVVLGPPATVRAGLERAGLEVDGVEIVDPDDPAHFERCVTRLEQILRARGASPDNAEDTARDPLVQAALLVELAEVAGAVAGSVYRTADVVRAALGTIGLAPRTRTLSSAFFMVFEPDHPIGPSVLTFTDAGVVPQPTAQQLAEIAADAAAGHSAVVGEEPRVAFLSYSTLGSAEGASVSLVREALARFRELEPGVLADGELQADAALVPAIGERKAPGSPVAGRANVLVFPDLAAANITYKLVQHLGRAHALGPILQGLAKPFNDLSRGATPEDIVAVSCISALMAE
jgi:phosphate acetyltransferase